MALRLEHPDLHWFFPILRPRVTGGPERMMEAMEEARHAELAARREHPHRAVAPGDPVGIYLGQVQALRRIAAARPAMGARKVILVGDAESLVPQEASHEAANALLKVLEEPSSDTTIVLTAADPDALLPTIRSRLQPIRLRALPCDVVAQHLRDVAGIAVADADRIARLSEGSIGRALAFLPVDGEAGPLEELRARARAVLEAALARGDELRHGQALAQAPSGARGAFAQMLDALILWIRDLAATAAGAEDVVVNTDALPWLRSAAATLPSHGDAAARSMRAVEDTLRLTQLNVNPQLALSRLLRELRRELRAPGPA
jgi:DNA polymerase-3 subunit delta'